jgi:hypothetical protein
VFRLLVRKQRICYFVTLLLHVLDCKQVGGTDDNCWLHLMLLAFRLAVDCRLVSGRVAPMHLGLMQALVHRS